MHAVLHFPLSGARPHYLRPRAGINKLSAMIGRQTILQFHLKTSKPRAGGGATCCVRHACATVRSLRRVIAAGRLAPGKDAMRNYIYIIYSPRHSGRVSAAVTPLLLYPWAEPMMMRSHARA